jgi:hypothetical protein
MGSVMSWTLPQIYQKQLDKLLSEGVDATEAESIAADQADRIFWDMVNEGRQRAKDGER